MDRITESYLGEFKGSQLLSNVEQAVLFEHFCNYCIVSNYYNDSFDVELPSTGATEFGIDGVAILVNGNFVIDPEDVDLLADSRSLEVDFIFVQAKRASSLDTGEVLKFGSAVYDFFQSELSFSQGDKIHQLWRTKERVFERSSLFKTRNPRVFLHFCYTGRWSGDQNVDAARNASITRLDESNLFSEVEFEITGANDLQTLYNRTRTPVRSEFEFSNNIALPSTDEIEQSYIGFLPYREYARLICDENGNIRNNLFNDNVRDFQGNNPVNQEIASTLESEHKAEFPLRNNGVTVVARQLNRVGNRFHIEDYQVVNGCQTSHVLYLEAKDHEPGQLDFVMVPIKLISTNNEEVINAIIRASNRQTSVSEEQFWALDEFHKKVEAYMNTFSGDQRLYYERRSRQYDTVEGIEKVRIVTPNYLLRFFASMFLDEAHRATRYIGELKELIGKNIFVPEHQLRPYYTSAFAAFRLEQLIRNGYVDSRLRTFRYHALMVVRCIVLGDMALPLESNKMDSHCESIDQICWDFGEAQNLFLRADDLISRVVADNGLEFSRDTAKTVTFRDLVRDAALSG